MISSMSARMCVMRGALLGVVGLLFGGAGTLILGRVLRHALPGISGIDQATFLLATATLLAVALLASALPASRASRIDSIVALRGG